jgi:hypothetical protein
MSDDGSDGDEERQELMPIEIDRQHPSGKLLQTQQQQQVGALLAKQGASGGRMLADRMGLGGAIRAAETEARKQRRELGQLVIEMQKCELLRSNLRRQIAAAEAKLRGTQAPARTQGSNRQGSRQLERAQQPARGGQSAVRPTSSTQPGHHLVISGLRSAGRYSVRTGR